MIVEEGPGRIFGTNCEDRETGFRSCVAVGYREFVPKEEREFNVKAWEWIGSGVLIDWDVVVSAAHVVPGGPSISRVSSDPREENLRDAKYEWAIFIGETTKDLSNGRLIPISTRVEHPDFDGNDFKHDLALFHLSEPAKPLDIGGPATKLLPIAASDVWNYDGAKSVRLVGYGVCRPGEKHTAGTRRGAKVSIVPLPYDTETADKLKLNLGYEFAAGGNGFDTCGGDSGGAAVTKDKDGNLCLVGCTSRGLERRLTSPLLLDIANLDRAARGDCGQGGAYVLLSSYLDSWIKPTVEKFHSVE